MEATAGALRFGPAATALSVSGRADCLPSTRVGFLSSNFGSWIPCSRRLAGQHRPLSARSIGRRGRRAGEVTTRASAADDSAPASDDSADRVAPLQLESPVGQFLSQILVTHPHLLPAAVDQQLERLQTDREAQEKEDPSYITGTDLVLYRRISELKATERKNALEEILYTLVVQRFMDAGVQLTPAVSKETPFFNPAADDGDDEKLLRVHSPEAAEMIDNHLRLILGQRLSDPRAPAQISRLRVGQVYAASVMYGYFLKRVDQRFQLEKRMKTLPRGVLPEEDEQDSREQGGDSSTVGADGSYFRQDAMPPPASNPEFSSSSSSPSTPSISPDLPSPGGFGFGIKNTPLRAYVMSFDQDTLQECANVRSKEAVAIIEKHTEALLGRAATGGDQLVNITIAGLKKLVLEAVTFGSFLWEVETFVDTRYHFVTN